MDVAKETSTAAVLRLLAETNGGPIDSGIVSRLGCMSVKLACTALTRLGTLGKIHLYRAVAGKLIYAFSSEAHCIAHGVDVLEADAQKRLRDRNIKAVAGKNRAIPLGPGFDAGVTIKPPNRIAWANKVADMSRAKVIHCPSPVFTARWQSQPSSEAHTGFAAEWAAKRGQA